MAIASINVQVISRGKGRSAVAAAAYRAGEKLHDEYEGNTYDYSRKSGIVYTEILAPPNVPGWTHERQTLWNAVERVEKQGNARLAREVMIALPCELTPTQNIALAHAYAQTFVNEGMIADLAIHDKGDGNPHAHILLTTRPILEDGTWAAKSRKDYILDAHGERIRLPSGEYKSRKIDMVDWNTLEKLLEWRKTYENMTNYHLARHGHAERICVDRLEAQGIDREPTIHLGHYAHQMELRGGEHSERGTINREIEAANRERDTLARQLTQVEDALKQEETARRVATKNAEMARQQQQATREEALKLEMLRQQQAAEKEQRATAQQQEAAKQEEAQQRQQEAAREQAEKEQRAAARQQEALKQQAIKEAAQEAYKKHQRKHVRPQEPQQKRPAARSKYEELYQRKTRGEDPERKQDDHTHER